MRAVRQHKPFLPYHPNPEVNVEMDDFGFNLAPIYHAPVNHAPVNHAPINHAPINHASTNHAPINHVLAVALAVDMDMALVPMELPLPPQAPAASVGIAVMPPLLPAIPAIEPLMEEMDAMFEQLVLEPIVQEDQDLPLPLQPHLPSPPGAVSNDPQVTKSAVPARRRSCRLSKPPPSCAYCCPSLMSIPSSVIPTASATQVTQHSHNLPRRTRSNGSVNPPVQRRRSIRLLNRQMTDPHLDPSV